MIANTIILKSEGTADMTEFDKGLRQDHSKHEQEYTPDVYDAYKVLEWDMNPDKAEGTGTKIGDFSDIKMSSKFTLALQVSFP